MLNIGKVELKKRRHERFLFIFGYNDLVDDYNLLASKYNDFIDTVRELKHQNYTIEMQELEISKLTLENEELIGFIHGYKQTGENSHLQE